MTGAGIADTPYKGLVPYEEEDAPFFFGRDSEREIIIANLMASRLTVLYGTSGVGKSSVLRAGVAHHLRESAEQNLKSRGDLEFAVIVFSSWRDSPVTTLEKHIDESLSRLAPLDPAHIEFPKDPRFQFPEFLDAWSQQIRADLFIIFDQFEEYFLYHPQEDGEDSFAIQFPRAVNRPDLRVSFLISIREDSLGKLDRFKGRIPNLFDNYLRVDHLDRQAASRAITEPIKTHNTLHQGSSISIEPALVAAVLDQVKTGEVMLGAGGRGTVKTKGGTSSDERIEASYLQLVMTRLWQSEMEERSHLLRLETLTRLGGANRIVQTHVDGVIEKLAPREQDAAAKVFHHLVTRDGTKIAHTVSALSEYTRLDEAELKGLLERLSGEDARILQPVAPPPEQPDMPRYEIRHDKLAAAILDWRRRYTRRQEMAEAEQQLRDQRQRARRLSWGVIFLLLLLVAMTGLTIYAFQQRAAARLARAEAEREQRIAFSRYLTDKTLSILDDQFDTALLLGLEASRLADIAAAKSALIEALENNSRLVAFLSGHTAQLTSIAVSPDGKILASGSEDQTVRLWDLGIQKQVRLLKHTGAVRTVALDTDGKLLASGGEDGTIILWDVATGEPNGRPLVSRGERIDSLAFRPGGKMLASNGPNQTILWDIATRQPVGAPLPGHGESTEWPKHMAFSPDGRLLATPSAGDKFALWDVESRKPLGSPLSRAVHTIAFNPDGTIIATSGWGENQINLWNLPTLEPVGSPLKPSSGVLSTVTNLAFSPDGKLLAADTEEGDIVFWEVPSGQPFGKPLKGHKAPVGGLSFTPDGRIVSGSGDVVILWDLKQESRLSQALTDNQPSGRTLAASPDGKILASDGVNNTITLWDFKTGRPIGKPLSGHSKSVISMAFSPDSRMLASGSEDHSIILWDLSTGLAASQPLLGPDTPVIRVVFTPDGKNLISDNRATTGGFADTVDVINVWDLGSHTLKQGPFEGRGEFSNVTAWSPNNRLFAKAQADGTIILWDIAARTQIGRRLSGHSGRVSGMVFSPDGRVLASAGGYDEKIVFWNTESGQIIGNPLAGYDFFATRLAISPNGKILAAGVGGDIVLFDVSLQRQVGQPLDAHKDFVAYLAFSPDGKTLASAGQDGAIILWDVSNREILGHPFSNHKSIITSLAFSADGTNLAVGSHDRPEREGGTPSLRLWDLAISSWQSRVCSIANRNLSRPEWQKYFGDSTYRKTCPSLPVHYSFSDDGRELADRIENFLANGIIKEAVTIYKEAQKLNTTSAFSAETLNSLCWDGSLQGYVSDVMIACNQAVMIQPQNGSYRDSRGVARALLGEIKGAIEDFQAYINWTTDDAKREQRRRWVQALQAGKNPFPQELETLRR